MNIDWNAKEYLKDFAFVPKYGEAVLDMIDAAPGTLAVDLGCGNGGLTGKLIERGYRVIGVDASVPMLALARERHPDTTFLQADACTRSNCRSRRTSSSATQCCTGSIRQSRTN